MLHVPNFRSGSDSLRLPRYNFVSLRCTKSLGRLRGEAYRESDEGGCIEESLTAGRLTHSHSSQKYLAFTKIEKSMINALESSQKRCALITRDSQATIQKQHTLT